MFPITLIYGDTFLDGNVYSQMELMGLVSVDSKVAVA